MTKTQRAVVSWKLALRRLAAGVVMMIAARSARAAALPAELPPARLQALLQRFVSRVYLKGFRHLGDERDFDHGHVLYDAEGRPIAILYHTQELADEHKPGTDFSYIDPGSRNWIQWLDGDRIENAAAYERQDYPATATWDFFRAVELPGLARRHTVLPKMLDPKLGLDENRTLQWVFTRKDCAAAPSAAADDIRVVLPNRELVCLGLSAT